MSISPGNEKETARAVSFDIQAKSEAFISFIHFPFAIDPAGMLYKTLHTHEILKLLRPFICASINYTENYTVMPRSIPGWLLTNPASSSPDALRIQR